MELLVVLALVAIGSVIVLPTMDRWLREKELRLSTLELAATARNLRRVAIHGSSLQSLVVNRAENSYRALRQEKVLSSDLKITNVEGGEPLGNGLRQFLFFPNGSVLGGEIGLSSREAVTAYVVRLEPLSGRIDVVRSTTR